MLQKEIATYQLTRDAVVHQINVLLVGEISKILNILQTKYVQYL